MIYGGALVAIGLAFSTESYNKRDTYLNIEIRGEYLPLACNFSKKSKGICIPLIQQMQMEVSVVQ